MFDSCVIVGMPTTLEVYVCVPCDVCHGSNLESICSAAEDVMESTLAAVMHVRVAGYFTAMLEGMNKGSKTAP